MHELRRARHYSAIPHTDSLFQGGGAHELRVPALWLPQFGDSIGNLVTHLPKVYIPAVLLFFFSLLTNTLLNT